MKKFYEFHLSLKFTYMSTRRLGWNVTVEIDAGRFITSLFCKPTNCLQYLHYESPQPAHVKKSIVYSQGLRIKRVC